MADYIEREAAFDAITDLAGKSPTRSAYEAVWKSARALKKIPAADVAQIEALERLRDELCAQAKVETAQLLISQYMIDTLQMVLHESEGWGYDRIMRLESAWHKIRGQYAPAINPSDPEADVYQEHMDRVLAEIISGKQELYPFESRYPELKKIKYGR